MRRWHLMPCELVVVFMQRGCDLCCEWLMSRSVPHNGKLTSHQMRINGLKKKKKTSRGCCGL